MGQPLAEPRVVALPVKLLLTVDEASAALSLGRTSVYKLVLRKEIFSVKVGGARRIPVAPLPPSRGQVTHLEKSAHPMYTHPPIPCVALCDTPTSRPPSFRNVTRDTT